MFAPTKIKHPNGPLEPALDMRLRRAATQFPRLALLVFGTDVALGALLLTLLVWTCRA